MRAERILQLEHVFLQTAENISTMSRALRKKTGAVLCDGDNIISFGWNGMPADSPDDCCELKDDDGNLIYTPDGELITNPLVLHAEANAILKLTANGGMGTKGATLYCTLSPCIECSKLVLQAKIARVVFREIYRIPDGIDILTKYKVKCDYLPHRR